MNAAAAWETHTARAWRGARARGRGASARRGQKAWQRAACGGTQVGPLRARSSPCFRAVTGPCAGGGACGGVSGVAVGRCPHRHRKREPLGGPHAGAPKDLLSRPNRMAGKSVPDPTILFQVQ